MTTTAKNGSSSQGKPRLGARTWGALYVVILGVGAAGCGPEDALESPMLVSQNQELGSINGLSANGLSANGLSANGLSANGLSANGLSANGLSANGLSSSSFSAWFSQDPARADMLMRYLVRCAVPAGETRSYTNARGQRYTWSGALGLAPIWASGAQPPRIEQQVITACLLAHVNRYGLSVPISVLGRDAEGKLIPFNRTELETYSVQEACFFGNLFTQEGLFFGVDQPVTDEAQYLTRACAGMEDASGSPTRSCAPLRYVGACSQSCTSDSRGPFYRSCTYNGASWPVITTRMRQSDYATLFAEGTGDSGLPSGDTSDDGSKREKKR